MTIADIMKKVDGLFDHNRIDRPEHYKIMDEIESAIAERDKEIMELKKELTEIKEARGY